MGVELRPPIFAWELYPEIGGDKSELSHLLLKGRAVAPNCGRLRPMPTKLLFGHRCGGDSVRICQEGPGLARCEPSDRCGAIDAVIPNAGTASIYVYRQGSMVGAIGHPYVFVNDNFLAVLKTSNFVKAEMPPGPVNISATVAETKSDRDYGYLRRYLPPGLSWPKCEGSDRKTSCTWPATVKTSDKEDHGCGKVDWRHVEDARKEDLRMCSSELVNTSASIEHVLHPHAKAEAIIVGMLLPAQSAIWRSLTGLT